MDLALTLERPEQVREAVASYMSVLEVYPGYMPAIRGAAQLTVSEVQQMAELQQWLAEIALGGESKGWRAWARKKAAELPASR